MKVKTTYIGGSSHLVTIKNKQKTKRYLINRNKYGFIDVYNASYTNDLRIEPIYTTSIALEDGDVDLRKILESAGVIKG